MDSPISRTALPISFYAFPVGVFFFLVSIGVSELLSAGIGLLGCLLASLGRIGIEFRLDRTAYREYYTLFGFRAGQWQLLKSVVGVTVKYYSEIAKSSNGRYSWGVWNNQPRRHEEVIIMLSIRNSVTGIILGRCALDDVNLAIDEAHTIAVFFAVPVRQYLPPNQFRPL